MSRSGHPPGLLDLPLGSALVGSFALARGARFDLHRHPTHRLVWARRGVATVAVGDTTWVLPPTRALWVPAGVAHTTGAVAATRLHSLYVRPEQCPLRWERPTALAVGPLLAELLAHLGRALADDARSRAVAVLFDLLEPAPVATVDLPWPADPRAARVADALAADPADDRSTEAWGRVVGASGRTLTRLFHDATGLGPGRWRTRLRVRAALELLACGEPVGVVAHWVGYRTASAFVAAFRRELGVTPAQCLGPRP